jgi:hypothetical protein
MMNEAELYEGMSKHHKRKSNYVARMYDGTKRTQDSEDGQLG